MAWSVHKNTTRNNEIKEKRKDGKKEENEKKYDEHQTVNSEHIARKNKSGSSGSNSKYGTYVHIRQI